MTGRGKTVPFEDGWMLDDYCPPISSEKSPEVSGEIIMPDWLVSGGTEPAVERRGTTGAGNTDPPDIEIDRHLQEFVDALMGENSSK